MAKVGRPPKKKPEAPLRERSATLAVDDPPAETVPAGGDVALPVTAEPNYPARKDSSNRVSIPVDPITGKIDWETMQDRTKEKASSAIRKSFNDPDFLKQCGIAPIEATQKPQIITAEAVGLCLDVIARIEAGVYAKKTGLEYDEVFQVVKWDKDDHRILDAQASGLANKYIPASWLQYADIGIFATTMFALMKQKAELVEQYAKAKFNRQIGSDASASNSPTPRSPASPESSNATTTSASTTQSLEIPPGEAARSLEDFSPNPAPPANGDHRSLG